MIRPSRNTCLTGSSAAAPVSALWRMKISSIRRCEASSRVHPVKDWATPFRNVTHPFVSVAITPSPILLSVVSNHCLPLCVAEERHTKAHQDTYEERDLVAWPGNQE